MAVLLEPHISSGWDPGMKSGSTAGVCPPAQHCRSEGTGQKVRRSYFPITEINTLLVNGSKQSLGRLLQSLMLKVKANHRIVE